MRYLLGFMCLLVVGMVPLVGCSDPEFFACDTVGDCIEAGHSCRQEEELFCRPVEDSGQCDCQPAGSGNECGRDVTCNTADTESCLATCQEVCGSGNLSVHTCFTTEDQEDRCYCMCNTGPCRGG